MIVQVNDAGDVQASTHTRLNADREGDSVMLKPLAEASRKRPVPRACAARFGGPVVRSGDDFATRRCLWPRRQVAPFYHASRACLPPMAERSAKTNSQGHRSSGRSPVCFAISASITGPISSLSCHAKRYCGQPSRRIVRCDPDVRTIRHPIRSNAASTRRAFVAGHRLKRLARIAPCRRPSSRRAQSLQRLLGRPAPSP